MVPVGHSPTPSPGIRAGLSAPAPASASAAFALPCPVMSAAASSSSSSSSSSASSPLDPSRHLSSPIMRALVAAWLADASSSSPPSSPTTGLGGGFGLGVGVTPRGTSTTASPSAAAGITSREDAKAQSFFARMTAALFSGLAKSHHHHHHHQPQQPSTRRTRSPVSDEAGFGRPPPHARIILPTSETTPRSPPPFPHDSPPPAEQAQCVSALCASLYSTFTSARTKDALRSLPFLLTDESVEARRLLNAMREARKKALDAARRQRSADQALPFAKMVEAFSHLFVVLNPLK